jgi:hypothetical protein
MANDLSIILHETGPLFAAAVGLEALAMLADTAGNQRGGEGEQHPERSPLNSFLLGAASLITPGVLMIYAWFALVPHGLMTRVSAVLVIIAAMIVGSILGWGVGRLGPARFFRVLSVPLGVCACALALFVSWPTLTEIVDALRDGRAVIVAPELQLHAPAEKAP